MTFDKTLLQRANVSLYHAMNLGGFAEYAHAGAILCREDLFSSNPYTAPFASDSNDRAHGLLVRVFGNLTDFGAIYSRATQNLATPNIYGPIQVRFPPSIWPSLTDVVLTRNTVMHLGARWRQHGIRDDELNDLLHSCTNGTPTGGFAWTEASASDRSLPLAGCDAIIVEPVSILGRPLLDRVRDLVGRIGIAHLVQERVYAAASSRERLQEEVDWLLSRGDVSQANYDAPRVWMSGANSAIVRRWAQWARMFFSDTVLYIRRQNGDGLDVEGTSAYDLYDDFDQGSAFSAFERDCEGLGDSPTADQICAVFLRHFKDPADGVPHDSGEGGYQYVMGGPYEAHDVLHDVFRDEALEEVVEDAVSRLIGESYEWVFQDQY